MVLYCRFNPFSLHRIKEHNSKTPLELAGIDTSWLNWIEYSHKECLQRAIMIQSKIGVMLGKPKVLCNPRAGR